MCDGLIDHGSIRIVAGALRVLSAGAVLATAHGVCLLPSPSLLVIL